MRLFWQFVRKNSFVIVGVILAACNLPGAGGGVPTETPVYDGPMIEGTVTVESLEALILESFPVQVNVTANGNLPDGCTTIKESKVVREANVFILTLATIRPEGESCTQSLVPYSEVVALDVNGLTAGTYTVVAGEATTSFTLDVDNIAPGEEGEGDGTTTTVSSISGVVFHDECGIIGGEGGEPAVPFGGCVALDDGGHRANGTKENSEPGIEGIEVALSGGACPGVVLETTFTNADGFYSFAGLDEGPYCISIDELANPNSGILIPGEWTTPELGNAQLDVNLAAGEILFNTNFGWDYQFLPLQDGDEATPPANAEEKTCEDAAKFVSETIEDDTRVAAGQTFVKSWTLKNEGTCRWEKTYKLVFVSGERMNEDNLSLPVKVPPGEEVTLSLELVAPSKSGTYRSDFKLQDEFGNRFGLGDDDKTFWVQIVVEGSLVDLDFGEPDWRDGFVTGDNWFLVDDPDVEFSINNNRFQMKAVKKDILDRWGLAYYPDTDNFYIEGAFVTGEACAGLDRYGFIVRAEPNAGYVINISCNGQFRVYSWNGTTYKALQEWTSASSISTGPNQKNVVGVVLRSTKIRLIVNNVEIASFTDTTFKKGGFGLMIGSTNTNNLKIFVEEVQVWELED